MSFGDIQHLDAREIANLQKEILYPTYFDKYHKVKIKDLTGHQRYNEILQVAIKTQNSQKKISTLSAITQTQKYLMKLLKHGFNCTNMDVDDVHMQRRKEDNDLVSDSSIMVRFRRPTLKTSWT